MGPEGPGLIPSQVNNADGITSGGNQFKVNEHGVIFGNVGTGGSVDVSCHYHSHLCIPALFLHTPLLRNAAACSPGISKSYAEVCLCCMQADRTMQWV